MPATVDENLRRQGFLKSVGTHAPSTLRRRLANWSTLIKWRGLNVAFTSLPSSRPYALQHAPLREPGVARARHVSGGGGRAMGHRVEARARSALGQCDHQQRAEMAGLDAAEFSEHGLRSGYLTEAANRGIPLPEAMEQSRHRSVQQASSYYNSATRRSRRAARLL